MPEYRPQARDRRASIKHGNVAPGVRQQSYGPEQEPLKNYLLGAALMLAAALPAARAAPGYPVQPVRFVVTTAPGGGLDAFARLVAAELTPRA